MVAAAGPLGRSCYSVDPEAITANTPPCGSARIAIGPCGVGITGTSTCPPSSVAFATVASASATSK